MIKRIDIYLPTVNEKLLKFTSDDISQFNEKYYELICGYIDYHLKDRNHKSKLPFIFEKSKKRHFKKYFIIRYKNIDVKISDYCQLLKYIKLVKLKYQIYSLKRWNDYVEFENDYYGYPFQIKDGYHIFNNCCEKVDKNTKTCKRCFMTFD